MAARSDENLVRHELSDTERASQTARRKVVYEALHPEAAYAARPGRARKSRQFGDNSSSGAERFTSATARATGRSERTVEQETE